MTIGVYGFTRDSFFDSLRSARIRILCDVRARRGMRGSAYAFANSMALQQGLREAGIGYVHRKDLAPSDQTRAIQKRIDATARTLKRNRMTLSPEFVERYQVERLSSFNAMDFMEQFPPGPIGLLCVERSPLACHRSLVADYLSRVTGAEVSHLCPAS